MTTIQFDPRKYETEFERFQAIPAGTYACVIEAEQVKPTKDNTGVYLELTLSLIEGEYKGRKLFDRVNLKNNSAKAVEIGLGRLSSICKALDIQILGDTNELVQKQLNASVGLEKDKTTGQYTGRNVILGYSKWVRLNHLGQPFVTPSSMAPTEPKDLSN